MCQIRLFVGSQGGTLRGKTASQRERENLTGDRCFTAAHPYSGAKVYQPTDSITALLDSGAFTHSWANRLSFEQALDNQLAWERKFSRRQGFDWQAYALASYDLLIDETWVNSVKIKRRWSIDEAAEAVNITVGAARYLNSQKQYLGERYLVLGAQGVNHQQYYRCVSEILELGHLERCWIGFGGWCVLGLPQFRCWLNEFYLTLNACVPLIASAGVKHIHLYGVLWEPALAPFTWMAHHYGLTCSTDSKQPITACRSSNDLANKKAGARRLYWRDNLQWWQDKLSKLSQSRYYQPPQVFQQLSLL